MARADGKTLGSAASTAADTGAGAEPEGATAILALAGDRDRTGRWLASSLDEQRAQNRRFLAALKQGRTPVEAALRAGRPIGTMRYRRRDAAFAAAWDEAQAQGRAARGNRRSAGRVGWTVARERRLLDELAAHANIGWAAIRAGLDPARVHARRRSHPGFRESFDAAIETGFTRLNAAVAAASIRALEPDEAAAEAALAGLTPAQAVAVWTTRVTRSGAARREAAAPEPAIADVYAKLRAQIVALREA